MDFKNTSTVSYTTVFKKGHKYLHLTDTVSIGMLSMQIFFVSAFCILITPDSCSHGQ